MIMSEFDIIKLLFLSLNLSNFDCEIPVFKLANFAALYRPIFFCTTEILNLFSPCILYFKLRSFL